MWRGHGSAACHQVYFEHHVMEPEVQWSQGEATSGFNMSDFFPYKILCQGEAEALFLESLLLPAPLVGARR